MRSRSNPSRLPFAAFALVVLSGIAPVVLRHFAAREAFTSHAPLGSLRALVGMGAGLLVWFVVARGLRSGALGRTVASAIALLSCVGMFALGQQGTWIDARGVWHDPLLSLSGARDATADVRGVALLATDADGNPERAELTLPDSEGSVTIAGAANLETLARLLAEKNARPTLSVATGSPAEERMLRAFARTRKDYTDLEPYLQLLAGGKFLAVRVAEEARGAASELGRTDSFRGGMLDLVSEELLRLPGILADAEVAEKLREKLLRRLGTEERLSEAAVQTARDGKLEGLRQLVDLLADSSYRVRVMAAQNLLVVVPRRDHPVGVTSILPVGDDNAGWNRFRARWKEWLATHASKLRFRGQNWFLTEPGARAVEVGARAVDDLDSLGEIIELLLAPQPDERLAAQQLLDQLVCEDDRPALAVPGYPLDVAWETFAEGWQDWFVQHRGDLLKRPCAEGEAPRWGRPR